jgi:hypothetical protein
MPKGVKKMEKDYKKLLKPKAGALKGTLLASNGSVLQQQF